VNKAAHRASRKAAWRLIPFLILCFFVAYLDRVNVGFAALTMNKELGLTAEMYGFVAGIFFFGYFIFEVPSNLILERVGARRWIARIMISWGVISVSFAFVASISATFQSLGFSSFDNARTFYLMRFIFGAAEAGFFPGIILYLTYWFTEATAMTDLISGQVQVMFGTLPASISYIGSEMSVRSQ
jgi:ACS family tartrate transporter-like MFS transporter